MKHVPFIQVVVAVLLFFLCLPVSQAQRDGSQGGGNAPDVVGNIRVPDSESDCEEWFPEDEAAYYDCMGILFYETHRPIPSYTDGMLYVQTIFEEGSDVNIKIVDINRPSIQYYLNLANMDYNGDAFITNELELADGIYAIIFDFEVHVWSDRITVFN